MDPARVREARVAAGLSLAELAGDDVSRTFMHLVEQGRSRPSKAVLALIARRTRKPIRYFLPPGADAARSSKDLADELSGVAARLRRFVAINRLTNVEREAMKLVEMSLRQGASLAKAIQTDAPRKE